MTHIFERAGLGRAPFRVVGVEVRRGPMRTQIKPGIWVEVGSPGQPMGSCDYCGTGIAECWLIQSADGERHVVGCECVRRTGDAGLKGQMAPHKRRLAHDRDDRRIDALRATLARPEVREVLAQQPSPVKTGRTALDWAEWMLSHAGRSGCIRVARHVERVAADLETPSS